MPGDFGFWILDEKMDPKSEFPMTPGERDRLGWVGKVGEARYKAQVFGDGQDGRALGWERRATGEL